MPAEFVALATLLHGMPPPASPPAIEADDVTANDEPQGRFVEPLPDEIRRFRAVVRDAVDARVAALLRELAVDVVARELRTAPCDIAALVGRLAHERAADEPLRVRIAPADAHAVLALPSVVDRSLAQGDAILECRSGAVDARLGTRLAAVVDGV